MKTQTLYMIPVVGLLVLAGVFFNAHPPSAHTDDPCPLLDGETPPPDPSVTAQQVEDGSASLKDFALAARDQFKAPGILPYLLCDIRQVGRPYRSGSTYLVQLTMDGRVYVHAKSMSLSGRLLNPVIYAEILSALGVSPTTLADLASPDPAIAGRAFGALYAALVQDRDAPFDATSLVPGASGYATTFLDLTGTPLVMLAGFDLDESHLSEEEIDYGNPAVTARDVVDHSTLKAFVAEAGKYFGERLRAGGSAATQAKIALRDPNGPWRHGSVYLYILLSTNNIVMFHGAFPDIFELQPLVGIARDGVTGELILPQVLEAAKSSPEGGFVEYFYDDPNDDTDSADIPKVGYAREFIGEYGLPDGSGTRVAYIIGSGFYGRAPEIVSTGPSTVVEGTVVGDAVEGLDVAFSRAVAGRRSDYAWSAVTDAAGLFALTISGSDGLGGYYRARATNAAGEIVGQWASIPLNEGRRQVLELTLGGGARVVRVASLESAEEPVAASKPAFASEAVPEASGLSPNSPNPFNSATLITYHLASAGPVRLVIYNVLGQPVRTLVDGSRAAGSYQVKWDARDEGGVLLSTGVYIARLSYPGGAQTQRLLYLK